MSARVRSMVLACAAAFVAMAPSGVRAVLIAGDTVTTQTATLPLTSTDFQPGNANVNPLVFQQFDTQQGARTLDAVDLSFSAQIQNKFGMTFTTPATITVSAIGPHGETPSLTLYQPDGVHTLLTVTSANDPASLSTSVSNATGATFSSLFATSSPYYLNPANFTASNALQLSNASDIALFSGTSSLTLPVSASAYSKFLSDSGNGSGWVTTQGSATVTVSYEWHLTKPSPETIPEPASMLLWSIGGVSLLVAHRVRSRRS